MLPFSILLSNNCLRISQFWSILCSRLWAISLTAHRPFSSVGFWLHSWLMPLSQLSGKYSFERNPPIWTQICSMKMLLCWSDCGQSFDTRLLTKSQTFLSDCSVRAFASLLSNETPPPLNTQTLQQKAPPFIPAWPRFRESLCSQQTACDYPEWPSMLTKSTKLTVLSAHLLSHKGFLFYPFSLSRWLTN